MKIIVPFFGNTTRFRPLLDRWVEAYSACNCSIPFTVLTDSALGLPYPSLQVDPLQFAFLMRPDQPFDRKGAMVCAALLVQNSPLLVLDADAVLLSDPAPLLERLGSVDIAMPVDHGALVYYREPFLNGRFSHVRKSCAGVMYFGDRSSRCRLVHEYGEAWKALASAVPWTPPLRHLVEQYAWSVVLADNGGKMLPHSMNWAVRHFGDVPGVIINHDYGHGKWGDVRAPLNS